MSSLGASRTTQLGHELLVEEKIHVGSERSFGITFSLFFLLIAVAPLFSGHPLRVWALCLSIPIACITFLRPSLLHYPNVFWFRFGLLLAKVSNPIVLGILFYCVFTPMALLRRMLGGDSLERKFDRSAKSYWTKREKTAIEPKSLKMPF